MSWFPALLAESTGYVSAHHDPRLMFGILGWSAIFYSWTKFAAYRLAPDSNTTQTRFQKSMQELMPDAVAATTTLATFTSGLWTSSPFLIFSLTCARYVQIVLHRINQPHMKPSDPIELEQRVQVLEGTAQVYLNPNFIANLMLRLKSRDDELNELTERLNAYVESYEKTQHAVDGHLTELHRQKITEIEKAQLAWNEWIGPFIGLMLEPVPVDELMDDVFSSLKTNVSEDSFQEAWKIFAPRLRIVAAALAALEKSIQLSQEANYILHIH